jgi:IS605 OrfB family transposase
VRTRLRLEPAEEQLLQAVGEHLTRVRMADLRAAAAGAPRNDRVKAMTAATGIQSRYAGTIGKDNDALVRLVKDGLYRRRADLRAAIRTLEHRTQAASRDTCCPGRRTAHACAICRDGYATRVERAMKCRRLDVLRARLVRVEAGIAARDWRLMPGDRRLAGTRHHLDDAELTVEQGKSAWSESRFFLASVGNAGSVGGNPCLSLDADGYLTVSVPPEVAEAFGVGTRVRLTHPVRFTHRGGELADRVATRQATRIDIEPTTVRGARRWYVRASWSHDPAPAQPLEAARAGGVIGVDLNADHLAVAVLDAHGNPVGAPHRIELALTALPASTRDARIREAITELLTYTRAHGLAAILVEELGFDTAEKSREKHGRRKLFRALISGFPTTAFRSRLVSMAATAGIAVISVDPRYTSVVGGRDWTPALHRPHRPATRHSGAAVAIGRRGQGLPLRAHRTTRKAAAARPVPHQRVEDAPTRAGTGTRAPASTQAALSTAGHPGAAPGRTPSQPARQGRPGADRPARTKAAPGRRISAAGTRPTTGPRPQPVAEGAEKAGSRDLVVALSRPDPSR